MDYIRVNRYNLALYISVISVSFASIFILSCKAPPLSIAFYRLLFTSLLLLPFVIFMERSRKQILHIPPLTLLYIALVGIVLAAHFAFWISSLYKTSVASSVILVTSHPVMVAPISHYLFREKIKRVQVAGMVLSLTGVIILVMGNYGIEKMSLEGNILAILGGIMAGIYILSGRKIRKNIDVIPYAFLVYAVASLALLLLLLASHSPLFISERDYGIIFLMALISGIFGHTLYNWVLKYVPAYMVSISFLGEPLASSLLAFIIPWIRQIPSVYTITGGCLTILGIYITVRYFTFYGDA